MENIELLSKAVEENYRDGIPLHVHETAFKESVFHMVTEAAFQDLPDREVQERLRQHHIIVYGCRYKETTFRKALQALGGGPERKVEIQGIYPYSARLH